jgi:hypothetical protein
VAPPVLPCSALPRDDIVAVSLCVRTNTFIGRCGGCALDTSVVAPARYLAHIPTTQITSASLTIGASETRLPIGSRPMP